MRGKGRSCFCFFTCGEVCKHVKFVAHIKSMAHRAHQHNGNRHICTRAGIQSSGPRYPTEAAHIANTVRHQTKPITFFFHPVTPVPVDDGYHTEIAKTEETRQTLLWPKMKADVKGPKQRGVRRSSRSLSSTAPTAMAPKRIRRIL